ncbi:MAG: CYTH domain-containing protein [Deltaproteobacteria bacterium]|nr:CYTH domain-containing protein [Deltaproteobacteria bacterium]
MLEVERKARVEDPGSIEGKLEGLGSFSGEVVKEDRYYLMGWEPGGPIDFAADPIFRVRTARGRAVLGWKSRTFTGTTEVNEEREIELGAPAGAIEWLEDYLGLVPFVVKHKRTRLFVLDAGLAPARVEINHVESLGHFVEVEVLCEPSEKQEAVRLIDEVFALLEIPDEAVETRYYIDLLMGDE